MKFSPADVLAARRELAKRSLADFACMVDIPTVPLTEDAQEDRFSVMRQMRLAAHHQLLCEKLQGVEDGSIPNLMLLLPPGSAKSTYADVVFVPWYMSRKSRRNVILASYASEIAEKQGRRARQLINSRSFHNLTGCALKSDQKAAHQWTLDNGSEFMAGGILSGLTGNRAHCFPGETLVMTSDGEKRIDELVNSAYSGYVLSYEPNTGKLVERRVKAVARRDPQSLYRIVTADGRVVRCTGDHRVYTSRGYVEARFLSVTDRLLCLVRSGAEAQRLPDEEGRQERSACDLLRPCVPTTGGEFLAWEARHELQNMRSEDRQCEGQRVLLGRLQECRQGAALGKLREPDQDEELPYLQQGVQATQPQSRREVLLAGMQQPRACAKNATGEQSWLAARCVQCAPGRACGTVISGGEAAHQGAGPSSVRGLREQEQIGSASHRYGCDEQSLGQPSDAVQLMPHEAAWCGSLNTEGDAVSVVERLHESATVYDIQVDGTECFFANGILVHNCGIIDDPIRGREAAESETIRVKTWDAYVDDFCSRLIPGAPQIMILTRWHEDDPAGRILPDGWDGESGWCNGRDGRRWYVICLPAIADRADDPLGRKIGETLWPEWFSHEHWAPFQRNPRTWSSLYQQKPSPQEGTYFKREWFKRYRTLPKHLHKYITSDHAPGGTEVNDYTCVRVWGVDPEGDIYLVDGFRSQETLDTTADRVVGNKVAGITGLIERHKPLCWFPEDDNNWKSARGFIARMMREQRRSCRIEPVSPHGSDKPTKAQPFQAMASSGRVWLPDTPDGDDVLAQYLKFPGGRNDDEIDAAAIIGRVLDDAHPAIARHDDGAKKKVDRWDKAFGEHEDEDSWKTA